MNEVENYFEQFKDLDAAILNKISNLRNFIKQQIPNATEIISYGIPTYKLKKNIIHFGLNKNHIGIYPGSKAIEYFSKELADFKTSKGTVKVPFEKDLPFELIKKIIDFNLKL